MAVIGLITLQLALFQEDWFLLFPPATMAVLGSTSGSLYCV
jgi:hypothetical protein